MIVDAGEQVLGGLPQLNRHGLQPRDVVVVVLHRLKRPVHDLAGQVGVDAVKLVNRQLPLLELRALFVLDQFPLHQLGGELLLIAQAARVDRQKAGEEHPVAAQLAIDRGRREIR